MFVGIGLLMCFMAGPFWPRLAPLWRQQHGEHLVPVARVMHFVIGGAGIAVGLWLGFFFQPLHS
jgi:hypothetical protein